MNRYIPYYRTNEQINYFFDRIHWIVTEERTAQYITHSVITRDLGIQGNIMCATYPDATINGLEPAWNQLYRYSEAPLRLNCYRVNKKKSMGSKIKFLYPAVYSAQLSEAVLPVSCRRTSSHWQDQGKHIKILARPWSHLPSNVRSALSALPSQMKCKR